MGEAEERRERLRSNFCPPIDEPAFYAICSDYDLTNREALGACLRNLKVIKAAALEADTSAFDASGTGGSIARDPDASHHFESSHNWAAPGWQEVDSITTGLSGLAWDDPSAEGQRLDDAGEDVKTRWLNAMFPHITDDNVSYRLRKCNGNLTRTIDELLNLSFIDQTVAGGPSAFPKGIDGFTCAEDYGHGRKGKGKGKGKRRIRTDDSSGSSSTTSVNKYGAGESNNVWTAMAKDVEFICARTNLHSQTVKLIYNTQNNSLARTISSMASKEGTTFESIETLEPVNQVHFEELRNHFPELPNPQIYGLLVISGNRMAAAHELAAAMVTMPKKHSADTIQWTPKSPPIDLSFDTESRGSRSSFPSAQVNPLRAKSFSMAKAAAASTAFSQASSAYRRGKSDHYMGGAAAYYADVGREDVRVAKELSARAAESLVISQSTPKMLDLHGVCVADAVRIAREQLSAWWRGLGDTKYAPGGGGPAREGYRIVTGIGRHSKDGAPKIGPAVSRMLVREGWKVTVGHGEILVTGKARRS